MQEGPLPQSRKPILAVDFDGVLHGYQSGWMGAGVCPDPPVPGALEFVVEAMSYFEVHVFSARSSMPGGIEGMRAWVSQWGERWGGEALADALYWPTSKPPATLIIDDRAIQFTGQWPPVQELLAFQPWNKRDL